MLSRYWSEVWFLLLIASISTSQSQNELCYNIWEAEPNLQGQVACNIFDEAVTVQLRCRITMSNPNTSIVWLYSNDNPGDGGEPLNGVELQTIGANSLLATLNLTNSPDVMIEPGYYWCVVRNVRVGSYQPPSTVVHITEAACLSETACSPSAITVAQRTDLMRCANGEFEQELVVGELQNNNLCTTDIPTTNKGDTSTTVTTEDAKTDTTISPTVTKSEQTTTAQGTDESVAGLSTGIIWLIVGVTIAFLLIIIALLLGIIMCLQCSRRKVKDRTNGMPHQFDNRAYQQTELDNSFVQAMENKSPPDSSSAHHTYAVIPENFTLTALSGEHSPSSQTNQQSQPKTFHRSLPGQYEDVDLDPVTVVEPSSAHTRSHQYESVGNDEDEVGYNRLQRTGSQSRKISSSTSVSGVPAPLPPSLPPHGEAATPLAPPTRETTIFDNPKYSQLNKPNKHADIYKSSSSDSASGGTLIISPNQNGPNHEQVVKPKLSNPLSSQRNVEDDEYFQDSAMFIVNDLAVDETKRSTSQNQDLPTDHYTSLQQSDEPGTETEYTVPIVSTDDKYVSEQGHLYQMLESAQAKNEDTNTGNKSPETALVIANSDVFKSNSTSPVSTNPNNIGVAYHTLVHTREDTPTSSAYNVIDRRSTKPSTASSQSSLNSDVAYNVIDRKSSNSQIPLLQYDVIERTGNTSRLSNSSSPQASRIGYSIIARNSNSPPTSGQAANTSRRSVKGSSSSPSPPPSYSSLEIGGAKPRVCQCDSNIPFYHSLQQANAEVGVTENGDEQRVGEAVYHTISDQNVQP